MPQSQIGGRPPLSGRPGARAPRPPPLDSALEKSYLEGHEKSHTQGRNVPSCLNIETLLGELCLAGQNVFMSAKRKTLGRNALNWGKTFR